MALKTKYSPLQKFSFRNIFTAYSELSPSKKILSLVGTILMIGMIVFFPVSFMSDKVSELNEEMQTGAQAYRKVSNKAADYQRAKADYSSLEARYGKNAGNATSRVQEIIKQIGLTIDQRKTDKANQETDELEINSIEVKISNVTMEQVLELLYRIENDPMTPMRVRRLELRTRTTNRQSFDIQSLEVASFALKKES